MDNKKRINRLANLLYYDLKDKYIAKVQAYERIYDVNRKLIHELQALKSRLSVHIIGRKYTNRAVGLCIKILAKHADENNWDEKEKEVLVEKLRTVKLSKVTLENKAYFENLKNEVDVYDKKNPL